MTVYLGPTLRQKCVFSQLLLLDPEQLLKLISIEILLILAPEQRRRRPGKAAALSRTGLTLQPGLTHPPRSLAGGAWLYAYMVKLLSVVWQGSGIHLLQALFLSLPLEFGETKMVPLWSGNYDSIWPAWGRYDAAYSQPCGNSLTAGKSH